MSIGLTIKNYFSLIKFSHTIFALPFAFIGFFLGSKEDSTHVNYLLLVKVILCMVFARSAAMAFNRYIDRKFDALNPRTKIREVPSGKIKASNALLFTIIMAALFITVTWFINDLCFYLSPIALLVILGYSFTKRFTSLCHVILGIGLSLAPIGSYLAVTGKFDLLPLLFSFIVLFWVSGFDIIYALQDAEFDLSNNLKSIPGYLGKKKALRLSELLHLVTLFFLVWAGIYGQFSFVYWIGASLFGGLVVFQHTLVSAENLSRVNLAFATTNGIGSVVFSLFTCIEILK